ncbi:MAG: hypothetical protein SVR04_16465 [Spirochaetota bacterium]|nr:hypothetical protein [Spirochaetota bacterium]
MEKKWFIAAWALIFACAANLGAFETYVGGSPLVDELIALYSQAGRVFPTASFPVDKAELHAYAADLRRDTESSEIRAEIDRYLEGLAYRPEEAEVVSEESLAYEHYLRGDAVYTKDIDYYRSYIAAEPFFSWALSAGSDGGTGIHVSADLARQSDPNAYPENNLFESEEGDPVAVENYFITTGYVTHRSGDLLFQFGRTPMHFGGSDFSSVLPSDRLPYMDAFYYTWSFGPLKMASFFSSLYNSAGGSEIDEMSANVTTDGIIYYDSEDVNGNYDWNERSVAFDSTMILVAMHRFEWAFERLRLGMTALHLSSREDNGFHIGDIFPVFSWHNGQVGVHNMSLVLEASLAPLRGLELFAQAGYDDINSEDITGVGDTDIPTIPAYLLGAKYSHMIGDVPVEYLLEGGYTHYLWGNFHEFDPKRGNYLSRAIYRYLRDAETVLLPLTSPYGPGALWIRADVTLRFTPSWGAALITETVFRNTQADLVTTAYAASEDVENAAMELWGYYAVKADYSKDLGDNCRFSIYVSPAILVRDAAVWPELNIGGTASFFHRSLISK